MTHHTITGLKREQNREDHLANLTSAIEIVDHSMRQQMNDTADQLAYINRRLLALENAIREGQPRTHKALLLSLRNCGPRSEPSCHGCPHPRWLKWVNPSQKYHSKPRHWFATNVDAPMRHARAKQIPESTRNLMREALALIEFRSRFLEQTRKLRRASQDFAAWTSRNEPNDLHE